MNSLKKKADLLEIVDTFGRHKTDTGSPETQIAILTKEIRCISDHLANHRKDKHCLVRLKKKSSKQRSLLKYLIKENYDAYNKMVSSLNIRVSNI